MIHAGMRFVFLFAAVLVVAAPRADEALTNNANTNKKTANPQLTNPQIAVPQITGPQLSHFEVLTATAAKSQTSSATKVWQIPDPSFYEVTSLTVDRPKMAIARLDALLANPATSKAQRGELILIKAWALFYAGDWANVPTTLNFGMTLIDQKSLLTQYYRLAQANFFSAVGETQQAFSQLDAVGQYLKLVPHPELQKFHLQISAQLHQDAKDYDMALYFYLKLLDELNANSSPLPLFSADRGTVLRGLAFVYYMLDDKILAERYLFAAEQHEPATHRVALAEIACLRGYQLQKTAPELAEKALLPILAMAKNQQELYCSPFAYAMLSQIYQDKSQQAAALNAAQLATQLVKRENPDLYLYAWYNLGYLYLQQKQPQQASQVIVQLEQFTKNLPENVNHAGLLYLQAADAQANGDYQQALAFTQKYYQQELANIAQSNTRNIARYRYLYDQEKSAAQSHQLQLKAELSAAALASQQASQRIYLAGTAVVFSLLLGVWLLHRRSRAWQQRAFQLQMVDPLTKLPNQNFLAQHTPQLVAMARRYQFELAMVVLEIDDLAELERQFGEPAISLVVKEFAALCRQHLRETDQLVRLSGGHFAMVLPYSDDATTFAVLHKLQAECALAISPLLPKPRLLSFSAGIQFSSQQADPVLLVLEAERALSLSVVAGNGKLSKFVL